ncbi:hypothetical protein V1525DRAFT_396119 [Lipomyces kononenkoae]|uniref:Uncharacterized protein n=1 Tax=Lipomyces kononenkoae TaxID=34357 RepID=A0ACC3T894_LIPKO
MARQSRASTLQSSSAPPSARRRISAQVASDSAESRQASTPTTNGKINGKAVNGTPMSAFKTPPTQMSVRRSGHITFDGDGEENGVNGVADTPRTGYFTAEEELSDSSQQHEEHDGAEESDDTDEAPEDVSFQGSRQAAILQQQATKRQVEIARDERRAKRKANDERLRAQKDAKKAKDAENSKDESVAKKQLPLFLPSSILKEVTTTPDVGNRSASDDDAIKKPTRKKTVFSEPDVRDIPNGEAIVRVLKAQKLKTMPPPAKTKLLKSRDKWLNRKTVRVAKAGRKIDI